MFIWNRSRYSVQASDVCDLCCFYNPNSDVCRIVHNGDVAFFGDCYGRARTDKKNVIFVQLDNE